MYEHTDVVMDGLKAGNAIPDPAALVKNGFDRSFKIDIIKNGAVAGHAFFWIQ